MVSEAKEWPSPRIDSGHIFTVFDAREIMAWYVRYVDHLFLEWRWQISCILSLVQIVHWPVRETDTGL